MTASASPRSQQRASSRVLHVVPQLELGGAERQLRYLCPELTAFGWEPHVACLRAGPSVERLAGQGVATHVIACANHYDPRIAFAIARLIRTLEPAVVQTWLPLMDVVGGLVARVLGVPWVVSERTLPSAYPESRKMSVRNRLATLSSAIVSNSTAADAWWEARLGRRVRRRVIANGLPLEELERVAAADPKEHGLSGDAPLVVFVGRLDAGKNVGTVIDVLARVTREGPAQGLLCGSGPLLDEVRQRLAREGLRERVRAPGQVAAVPALLKRASVFLSLSRYEGMPNAVMEAAALGCPIVLSDIPSHREVLSPDEALFVDSEDVAAASRAVLACLSAPAEAEQRAARARARTHGWSLQAAARAYAELYEELREGTAR